MILNESVVGKGFFSNKVYAENRLVPVCSKPDCYRTKRENLLCVLVSPNKKKAVMLDRKGEEYIIDAKEFLSSISYVNRDNNKVTIPRYVGVRGVSSNDFIDSVGTFIENQGNARRYGSWGFSELKSAWDSDFGCDNDVLESVDDDDGFEKAPKDTAKEQKGLFDDDVTESVHNNESVDCETTAPVLNESYTVRGNAYKCVGYKDDAYCMRDTNNEIVIMSKETFLDGVV